MVSQNNTTIRRTTMYQDEKLVCEDCGKEFDFTAGEQEFYAEKGLVNKPKDVLNVDLLAEKTTKRKEKCLMQFAQNAVLKLKFHSNQSLAEKFSAKIVSKKLKSKITKYKYI